MFWSTRPRRATEWVIMSIPSSLATYNLVTYSYEAFLVGEPRESKEKQSCGKYIESKTDIIPWNFFLAMLGFETFI